MKMNVPASGSYVSVWDDGVYNPAIWFSPYPQRRLTWGWIRWGHDCYLPRNWIFVGHDFGDEGPHL